MFALINMIIYPFVFIPESLFIDKVGIKLGMKICSGFTLVGSFLQIFINNDKSLSTCYIGQILSGLVRPCLLSIPGKITTEWFSEDKRTLICSICYLSDIAGILVGYLWSLAYIKENSTEEDFRERIFRYMLSKFIVIIVLCIAPFFIEKDNPEKPPSPSQNKDNLKNRTFKNDIKMLFLNKSYIFLLISTFFIAGYYYIMITTIFKILGLYGLTQRQSIYTFGLSSFIGIISSIIFSFILDKYKKYKLFMIIFSGFATLCQVFLIFLLELVKTKGLNQYAIGLVLLSLINVGIIPFLTIGMNYACEISYPVSESINGGFLMIMPQLCGIIGLFLFDHLIENYSSKAWISNLILLIFLILSCIFSIFLDDNLQRIEIDISGRLKEEKEDKKSENNNVEIKQN
jgi:FLVCR family feline leukemia virus subgroup C receptor-related protein